MAREIIKEDGYFGRKGGNGGLLNKGITGTMGRNGVFNMVYFGFYHSVKTHFPAYSVIKKYVELKKLSLPFFTKNSVLLLKTALVCHSLKFIRFCNSNLVENLRLMQGGQPLTTLV